MSDPSPELQAATLRRVTRRLIPSMFALYVANFLDRVNVSFAALQMNRDLGFSSAAYGLGAGMPARCSPSPSSCSRARPSRSPCVALPPCEPPHPPDRSAEGAKRGGRRALLACSYANAYLISAASVHGRPTNESPTGSPRTCPMGTVT